MIRSRVVSEPKKKVSQSASGDNKRFVAIKRVRGESLAPRHEKDAQREVWVRPLKEVPELLGLGYADARRPRELLPHHHADTLEIVLWKSGISRYIVDGSVCELTGGRMLVIMPGTEHGAPDNAIAPCEQFWLLVKLPSKYTVGYLGLPPAEGKKLLQLLWQMQTAALQAPQGFDRRLERLFLALNQEGAQTRSTRARLLVVDLLLDLVESLHVAQEEGVDGVGHLVDQCITIMHGNLQTPLRLSALASLIGVSESYLKLIFKKKTGVPPAEYYLRLRLEAALAMLGSSSASVARVAQEFGFESSQYFATACRRVTGRSPSDFRTPRLSKAS